MTLQTWVARFVVDHGRVTEEGTRLRTFQRRRLDEPEVDLHVLADPDGAKGDELGGQALEAIGRMFLQDRLSLTGGLMKALHSTHQTLLDWNRRSVPRDQVSVGVAAAIVNGNVVYLAQSGPGVVFHRARGQLYRYVAASETATPLGEGLGEAELRRFDMQEGDLLLVASASIESVVAPELLETLLERGSDQALPELYLMTRDQPNFALFLITCLDAADEEEPPLATEAHSGADERDAWAPASGSAGSRTLEEAPRRPNLMSELDDAAGDDFSSASVLEEAPQRPSRLVAVEEAPRLRSTGRPFDREADPYAADPELSGRVAVLARPEPLDISRPVVRLRSDSSVGRSDYARTTGPSSRLNLTPRQRGWVLVGLAAAIVIFLGAFAVPDLIRQGRTEKVETLITNAQAQLGQALAQQDPAQRRAALEETNRLTTEALRLDPVNPTASDLRSQATAGLKQLDAVFELGPPTALTTLSRQITGEVSVEGMTLAGSTAYLLDSKGGRIFSIPVSGPAAGTPTAVYTDGETYAGTPAKKPMFLTWDAAGQGRLLVLDAERKLFQIRPGSPPEPLPLRRTNTWSSVAGIAAYDGNLYVLDPKGNQVHRYLPAASGFDSEPSLAVSNASLANAVSLAIDSDIYIVLKTGQVQRFRSSADAGFRLGGIDRQPKTITGLAVIPTVDEVYLADAGNKRVIVAGRDGAYRRQLVSNAFTDLRAIAVDPTGGLLYVIVGDQLLSTPIVR